MMWIALAVYAAWYVATRLLVVYLETDRARTHPDQPVDVMGCWMLLPVLPDLLIALVFLDWVARKAMQMPRTFIKACTRRWIRFIECRAGREERK